LKTISYSYFNAIINYGLPFWGNSPHSVKIFKMQKRIIRIMIGCKSRVSCRNLFRRLEILPFVSQYILSLMPFVVKNKNLFTLNSENYTKSTRQFNNFYHPITNLTIYQGGVHYMGIKIFNNLPPYVKYINFQRQCLTIFRHVHKTAKSDYYVRHVCPSVHPSIRMEQLDSHLTNFH
jgi:hypothetical protein